MKSEAALQKSINALAEALRETKRKDKLFFLASDILISLKSFVKDVEYNLSCLEWENMELYIKLNEKESPDKLITTYIDIVDTLTRLLNFELAMSKFYPNVKRRPEYNSENWIKAENLFKEKLNGYSCN